MIKKGTWITIESVVLKAAERAHNLPADTQKTDLKKWVKGYLEEDGLIGSFVTVKTTTGRLEHGILTEANPSFDVNYGSYVPELKKICEQVRGLL
ncbi:MAG: 2-amino-4-oxopentanoate thiolase subunit OrtA [Defluviitaleaceae bacterium]|nr:2-amino-4-oxopentanoate thiolase subunit OrtA [Defluviitaleaceae bacterium]